MALSEYSAVDAIDDRNPHLPDSRRADDQQRTTFDERKSIYEFTAKR